MASHGTGRNGATIGVMTVVIRSALILWMCSGFCVCEDENPNLDFEPQGAGTPDTPAEDQPASVGVDDSLDAGGSDPSPLQDLEESWGSVVAEDTTDLAVPVPDDQEIETVEEDQSEAPQGKEESSPTEQPAVETEATPVLSQKPAELTGQPVDQELGDFIVRNDDDVICLRACFAALLKVDYVGQDEDGEAMNRTAEIPVLAKADVGGFCERGPSEQSALELQWGDGGTYGLKITFRKQNATTKGDPNYWEASRIQFTFDTGDSNYFDAAVNAGTRTVHTSPSATFFATPQGNSRVCEAEDDITMLPSVVDQTERVTVEISQLQMQPYGMVNGTFSEGVDCGEDLLENPNTNVASIAVGATLACLILVVIIVYAVGRKMGAINDRSGYKSVE